MIRAILSALAFLIVFAGLAVTQEQQPAQEQQPVQEQQTVQEQQPVQEQQASTDEQPAQSSEAQQEPSTEAETGASGHTAESQLENALRQDPPLSDVMPKNRPGMIVIRSESFLDESQSRLLLSSYFESNRANSAHVSAVILVPLYYQLTDKWSRFPAFTVTNPAADVPARELVAYNVLVNECCIKER